jgi:transcriptional regulator with XRE-family HTH domain
LSTNFITIDEVKTGIASRFKARRLEINLPQRDLASRAGVSLASLKRFERKGLISLSSLLSLAMALSCLDDFERLASESVSSQGPQSLDALLESPKARHRATGRQGRKHGL